MKKYFDWHVARTPEDTEDLFAAYQALTIEQFQLKQLSSVTTGTWKEMGIPLGLGFRLSSDLKKFKHAALACQGTSMHSKLLTIENQLINDQMIQIHPENSQYVPE